MNRFPGAWPGFRGWDGGKIHFKEQDFCSYYMFKTNFSGHNKIWEAQKKLGALPPNATRRLWACSFLSGDEL